MKTLIIMALCVLMVGCSSTSGFQRMASGEIITEAKKARSEQAKALFKHSHPCPSNGKNHGPCPGYVIDHITALDCGGADDSVNMQWQLVSAGKLKDKWERKGCKTGNSLNKLTSKKNSLATRRSFSAGGNSSSGNEYYTGSRGGCFTYSASGKKRYVDHSFCGR